MVKKNSYDKAGLIAVLIVAFVALVSIGIIISNSVGFSSVGNVKFQNLGQNRGVIVKAEETVKLESPTGYHQGDIVNAEDEGTVLEKIDFFVFSISNGEDEINVKIQSKFHDIFTDRDRKDLEVEVYFPPQYFNLDRTSNIEKYNNWINEDSDIVIEAYNPFLDQKVTNDEIKWDSVELIDVYGFEDDEEGIYELHLNEELEDKIKLYIEELSQESIAPSTGSNTDANLIVVPECTGDWDSVNYPDYGVRGRTTGQLQSNPGNEYTYAEFCYVNNNVVTNCNIESDCQLKELWCGQDGYIVSNYINCKSMTDTEGNPLFTGCDNGRCV